MTHEICYFWPDYKPAADKTGTRNWYLTYVQPIYMVKYKSSRRWYYLAECDCGEETITYPGRSMSCGCVQGRKYTPTIKIKDYERSKCCIRFPYLCKHYMECLDEMAFDDQAKRSQPSRFKAGKCYELTEEEENVERADITEHAYPTKA